jgi:hypothetical protein
MLSRYIFAVPCLSEWAAQPARGINILILGRIGCDPFPCYIFPADPASQSHVIFLFRLGQLANVIVYSFLAGSGWPGLCYLSFPGQPKNKHNTRKRNVITRDALVAVMLDNEAVYSVFENTCPIE